MALLIALASGAPARAAGIGHAGRWITDADGRVIVVHGVNMVEKRPPYAPDAVGFGDDDAAFLQSQGFDAVRLGVIWKAVEPQPGVYDDAYLARIAQTVDTLDRHGILTQLDFHQDQLNERFYGEGFPDWAIQDDGLPNKPDYGFGQDYLLMPALQHALDHFFDDDPGPGGIGLQERYAQAWAHVAARVGGHAGIMGYDLFNEPFPGSAYPTCVNTAGCPAFDAKLTALDAKVIAAIRGADPTGLAWYEPNVIFNNGSDTHVTSGGDPHAGFSFHDYCLVEPQTKTNAGCDAADDLVFANAAKHVAATGDALLLSEFGATDDESNNAAMVTRADRDMVSWMWWHYCACDDPTTTGPGDAQALVVDPGMPPAGANLRTGKLDTIVRPYPRLVAGTPLSWSFEPGSRTFQAAWSTTRADGRGRFGTGAETDISIPARQYPSGDAVRVSGGTISSAPGASTLVVRACAGATRVTVTVVPSGAGQSSCAPPALRLTASRRHLARGRAARLAVVVRDATGPIAGARVAFGRTVARTRADGRAVLRVRPGQTGLRTLRASAAGYPTARLRVRVTAASRRR